MSFRFQQPGSTMLLDEIQACAAGSLSGGGMFAFATKDGVDTFFDSPGISRLLRLGGSFRLIVGMDAITNGAAIVALQQRQAQHPRRLEAFAFIHPFYGKFHPKFTWFLKARTAHVIAGSGNLTAAGLGCTDGRPANWEAFQSASLTIGATTELLAELNAWFEENWAQGYILPLDDQRVLDRASENSRVRVQPLPGGGPAARAPRAQPRPPIAAYPGPGAIAARVLPDVTDTLIRELPKTRPGQADIGQDGLAFLGFHGEPTTALLQHVELNNIVGPVVTQYLFVNQSQNYRVEMAPIAYHGYDVDENGNRMILVAVRMDESTYRYTVVPVTHPSYGQLSEFLGPVAGGGRRLMRVRMANSEELRRAWPLGPRNLFPINVSGGVGI